ncbi:Rieske (2Fe-2S) protein [Spirosoma sp. SC4-14]|uniref:QcrA and Rieske domain-containing protein n=1 Tax=Spirosoma sp. SC4-14 TaxID=3128900 RepID=UPI0030CDBA00
MMHKTTESIDRLTFLKQLGLKGSALVAFYCAGTLSSCTQSGSNDPAPASSSSSSGSTTTGSSTTSSGITLDLTSAAYSKLTTVGNYAYTGNILVAHIKDGSYIALSKICTHEGSTVQYVSKNNNIYCPNHGATFSTTGAVTGAPASRALTQYKVTLSTDGKSLLIAT